ncbi:diadenosine tetraphosphatase [compost metagenome]
MTVQIKVQPHTIFFMLGYQQCGMTTFAQALNERLNDQMLSATGIDCTSAFVSQESALRYLAPDVDKYSYRYYELCESSLQLALSEITALTEYSVNKEFIVADVNIIPNGIGSFEKLADFVKASGYNAHFIVFDHDDHPKTDGAFLEQKAFKKKTLSHLPASILNNATFINGLPAGDWNSELKIEIEGLDLYSRCMLVLQGDERVAIIGDTHEHVDALNRMCVELREQDSGTILVLVGDYLDKGNQTIEMVKFIERFVEEGGILVHGNHEYSNYKRILAHQAGEEVLPNEHLTASPVLLGNKELADSIKDIYENHSVPFLKILGDQCSTVYVTHAPCKEKYIGKIHHKAMQKQRNVAGDRGKDYRFSYEAVFKEAAPWKPTHVFGHVSHGSKQIEYKNKVFLDTGAVYGYHLTSVVMDGKGNRSIHQFATEPLVKKMLPDNLHEPI